jgi:hypothetical protein
MPGKSTLTADAAEQAVLRNLWKSEQRGEADRARAILLTLERRRAGEIAAALGVHISTVGNWRGYFAHGGVAALQRRTAPGRQAATKTGATTAAGRWCVCVPGLPGAAGRRSRRGGWRISWLSHQLRQRGLPGGGRATPSKGARMQQRSRRAVSASPI